LGILNGAMQISAALDEVKRDLEAHSKIKKNRKAFNKTTENLETLAKIRRE
jgi:hypothetical protein